MKIIKKLLIALVLSGTLILSACNADVSESDVPPLAEADNIAQDAGGVQSTDRGNKGVADPSQVHRIKRGLIAAGSHSAVICSEGSVWTWGRNDFGQLGNGTTLPSITPVRVLDNAVYISANQHTMAILKDGSLWAWGMNRSGELGNGTTSDRLLPEKILDDVAHVSAGNMYTLAVQSDGTLLAWGVNWAGQLGDGTTETRHAPVRVMDDVVQVSAGGEQSAAIKSDGSLWTWGSNGSGQLGDGTTTDSHVPVRIMEDVIQVSVSGGVGGAHMLAIQTDGSLWGWGSNSSGQLSDGTTIDRIQPIKIMEDVLYVSSATNQTFVIKSDGSLWAWGANWVGQLGDGTTENQSEPVKIMEDVAQVSAGGVHTLAVETDGSLWVWGRNDSGQLGDYAAALSSTPIRIREKFTPFAGQSEQEIAASAAIAQTLIGTWVWDADASYTYTFFDDGWLSRGFAGARKEHYRWQIEGDDHLLIIVDDVLAITMTESWTFYIIDDVLTIESRHIPGLRFSYIKQASLGSLSDILEFFERMFALSEEFVGAELSLAFDDAEMEYVNPTLAFMFIDLFIGERAVGVLGLEISPSTSEVTKISIICRSTVIPTADISDLGAALFALGTAVLAADRTIDPYSEIFPLIDGLDGEADVEINGIRFIYRLRDEGSTTCGYGLITQFSLTIE